MSVIFVLILPLPFLFVCLLYFSLFSVRIAFLIASESGSLHKRPFPSFVFFEKKRSRSTGSSYRGRNGEKGDREWWSDVDGEKKTRSRQVWSHRVCSVCYRNKKINLVKCLKISLISFNSYRESKRMGQISKLLKWPGVVEHFLLQDRKSYFRKRWVAFLEYVPCVDACSFLPFVFDDRCKSELIHQISAIFADIEHIIKQNTVFRLSVSVLTLCQTCRVNKRVNAK